MKHLFLFALSISLFLHSEAQDSTYSKHEIHFSAGQYAASIATPSFSTLHPGLEMGMARKWNKHPQFDVIQSVNLGYFYHEYFQHATTLGTELGLRYRTKFGLMLQPFALGGGYVLSISDMTTLKWDKDSKSYEERMLPMRHNWMITVGATLGYRLPLSVKGQSLPLNFFVDYRMLVQGIVVKQTVPVVAYTPLRFGLSLPITLPITLI